MPFYYGASDFYVSLNGWFHFQNGILFRATISPTDFSNRLGQVEYRFIRTMEECKWAKWSQGWSIHGEYRSPETPDGPSEGSQDLIPSAASRIYNIDGPGPLNFIGDVDLWSEYVMRNNFVQHAEIMIPGAGEWKELSDEVNWHSAVWVYRRGAPHFDWNRSASGNSVGAGHITVGDDETPPNP